MPKNNCPWNRLEKMWRKHQLAWEVVNRKLKKIGERCQWAERDIKNAQQPTGRIDSNSFVKGTTNWEDRIYREAHSVNRTKDEDGDGDEDCQTKQRVLVFFSSQKVTICSFAASQSPSPTTTPKPPIPTKKRLAMTWRWWRVWCSETAVASGSKLKQPVG